MRAVHLKNHNPFNMIEVNNWYSSVSHNLVKYNDSPGMWTDNRDGTYGTGRRYFIRLAGEDWQTQSGYEGDPTNLHVGDTVGTKVANANIDESRPEVDLSFFPTDENIYYSANKVPKEEGAFLLYW